MGKERCSVQRVVDGNLQELHPKNTERKGKYHHRVKDEDRIWKIKYRGVGGVRDPLWSGGRRDRSRMLIHTPYALSH